MKLVFGEVKDSAAVQTLIAIFHCYTISNEYLICFFMLHKDCFNDDEPRSNFIKIRKCILLIFRKYHVSQWDAL